MDGSEETIRGDLLVEEGRIQAIGDLDQPPEPETQTIDLDGRVLLPGFIQPHIHLCQTLLRNRADDMALMQWLQERVWPYEAALTPETLHLSARLGLAELALGGTTTCLDMGTVRHTDAIGHAVEQSGLRAFIGKCMMDDPDQVPDPLLEPTDRSLRESADLCDRWHGAADGRIHYAFAPRFAVSCTDALLHETADLARQHDALIHTHSSETQFENEYTREHYDTTNIRFLDDIGLCGPDSVFAHGIHIDDGECDILANSGTAVCHCPSSNLKLASGLADMPRFDDVGVQTALAADGAPCNNNLDMMTEMRLASLIHKPAHGPEAMPAERILRLATIDGARALGISDSVGSLEVGKQADLCVLELDDSPSTTPGGNLFSQIVYSADSSQVRDVFVAGEPVVRNGDLLGTDLPPLLDEARRAATEIADKAF